MCAKRCPKYVSVSLTRSGEAMAAQAVAKNLRGDTWIATSAARRARPYRTSLICSYGAAFFNEIKQGFPSATYNKKQGHG